MIMLNMVRLANEVLEPLRMVLDDTPIEPESWVRNPELNVLVKGSKTTQHTGGGAIDFKHREAWNAFDCLGELQVGQRIIYLDGANTPLYLHASIPEQSWVWWEGKKSWKKPNGSYVLQSQICHIIDGKKTFTQYAGKRPAQEMVH